MDEIFNIIIIASSALLIFLILIQARGASLGAGFGGSSEIHTTRRGVDKTLHQITIIMAVIFVGSVLAGLFI